MSWGNTPLGGRWRPLPFLGGPPKTRPPRRERRLDDPLAPPGEWPTLEAIVDVPRLTACLDHNRRGGGAAPGPDDLRYRDLGRQEAFRAFRRLRAAVLDGSYRPPPPRLVRIPKRGGGVRELALDTLVHRALATSADTAVRGLLAPFMSPLTHSVGGRGVHALLAALAAGVRGGRYSALVNHDVAAAFPSVSRRAVGDAFRASVPGDDLRRLLLTLLFGADGEDRGVGIPQGLALSPQALDLTLSAALDRHWPAGPDSPVLLRYVDNIVVLTRDVDDGRAAVDRCRDLLRPVGLVLKALPEAETVIDLRGGVGTDLLGFRVSAPTGQMQFDVTPAALDSLRTRLEDTYRTDHPPLAALAAVVGWVRAMGPAFRPSQASRLTQNVLDTAAGLGFREIAPGLVRREWLRAWQRWNRTALARVQEDRG